MRDLTFDQTGLVGMVGVWQIATNDLDVIPVGTGNKGYSGHPDTEFMHVARRRSVGLIKPIYC